MAHKMNEEQIRRFQEELINEEKSDATIRKYIRDVTSFFCFLGEEKVVDKAAVIRYKQYLIANYSVSSVNSMLASVNGFAKRMCWHDCVVKSLKVQKEAFRSMERELSKEEYYLLLESAKAEGKEKLCLIMETICATGIRVSELRCITVEAAHTGRAKVSLKGKSRIVLLPTALCRKLKEYSENMGLTSGSIFITRNGRPIDRSNICRDMKALCESAGIGREKVFPHNLRHLFACTYYQAEKDISHLADLLGHSSIDTTRIYTMISGEEQIRRIESLGLVTT